MKKLITFIIVFLIIIFGIIYFTYGKEFLTSLDEKKVYNVENVQTTKINTLDEYKFFNNGVVTYNNQKIIFFDSNNNLTWESEDTEFSKKIYLTDDYIYRIMENTIQVIDKNNQKYVIAEIEGEIINVSRENKKTFIVVKNNSGQNSLYVMNENNEIIVDNKIFDGNITGVSISDKSEAYALMCFKFENNSIINTVYFNLLDDVELWNTTIEGEILVKTKIINNNVVVIGTKNVYYYNTNGKLMWKNGIYNKILDYEISKERQMIYMLYEKDKGSELIAYNFEGKITQVNRITEGRLKLKIYEDNIFVYNENSIYLIHGIKTDKIYKDTENLISDLSATGNDIRILSKDKLIKGQIK